MSGIWLKKSDLEFNKGGFRLVSNIDDSQK